MTAWDGLHDTKVEDKIVDDLDTEKNHGKDQHTVGGVAKILGKDPASNHEAKEDAENITQNGIDAEPVVPDVQVAAHHIRVETSNEQNENVEDQDTSENVKKVARIVEIKDICEHDLSSGKLIFADNKQ
jgi:hypothetical protein